MKLCGAASIENMSIFFQTRVIYFGVFVLSMILFNYCNLKSKKAGYQKVVCFGDSITQHGSNNFGWVSTLQNYYIRRMDVLNRGFSGYNTRWGLLMLSEMVIQEAPKIVFIFFGANDACIEQVGPTPVCLTFFVCLIIIFTGCPACTDY